MRILWAAVGILLLFMLCAAGLCEQPSIDPASDRLAEEHEAFGLAIRQDAVEQPALASPSDGAAQAVAEPASEPHKPDKATADTPNERPSAQAKVTVREVTRTRKSEQPEAKASEGGLLSAETDAEIESRRPDKVALLAEMGKERKKAPETTGSMAGTVVGTAWRLALVCGLAYLVLLALKWLYNKREIMPHGSRDLRIVDTVRLSPSSSLHVVDVRGKTLLVGCSSGQVSLLQEFEPGEVSNPAEQPGSRFAEYLEKYSASSKSNGPSLRIAALLKDCTTYLRKRYSGSARAGRIKAGEQDEV